MIDEIYGCLADWENNGLTELYFYVFGNDIDILKELCINMFLDMQVDQIYRGLTYLPQQMLLELLPKLSQKGEALARGATITFTGSLKKYYVEIPERRQTISQRL